MEIKIKLPFFQESGPVSPLRMRNPSTPRSRLRPRSDCWQNQLQWGFSVGKKDSCVFPDEAERRRKGICWVANSVKQKQANIEICQKCCGEIRQTKLQESVELLFLERRHPPGPRWPVKTNIVFVIFSVLRHRFAQFIYILAKLNLMHQWAVGMSLNMQFSNFAFSPQFWWTNCPRINFNFFSFAETSLLNVVTHLPTLQCKIQWTISQKTIFGHNFWLECPRKVISTQLSYILNALFRDTLLAYFFRATCHLPPGHLATLSAKTIAASFASCSHMYVTNLLSLPNAFASRISHVTIYV